MKAKPRAQLQDPDKRKDEANLGLLQRLLGTGGAGKPETAEDVEAKLAMLRAERDQARTAIERLVAERRELLKRDDTDKEIAAVEQKKRAAEIVLERLEIAEPQLVEALKAAQNRARAAAWRAIEEKYFESADDFLAAATQARAFYDATTGILKAAHSNGFATEALHLLPIPQTFLTPDVIDTFGRALDASHRRSEAKPIASAPRAPSEPPADVTIRFKRDQPILQGQRPPQIGEVRTVRYAYAKRWINEGAAEVVKAGTPSKPIADLGEIDVDFLNARAFANRDDLPSGKVTRVE